MIIAGQNAEIVIDLLVDGDLAKGNLVAGTGTIRSDGTVGSIGGVRQKVVAAEAAGADVMLVPQGNYDEALTAPRESIELISVATIDPVTASHGKDLPPAKKSLMDAWRPRIRCPTQVVRIR